MPIYDNIKKIAKAQKYPVYDLEKAAGLARGSICKWNTVSPSVNSLKKVADILKVPIEVLIRG